MDRARTSEGNEAAAERRVRRVLLAEDDPASRQVTLGILRKLGVKADAVSNGSDVLSALDKTPYDLVLMDIQMPLMDGLEATRLIRSRAPQALNDRVPVIAMTAQAMSDDRENGLAAGMDDYISKPVSPSTLALLLRKWLAVEHAAPQTAACAPSAETHSPPDTQDLPAWDIAGLRERAMSDESLIQTLLTGFQDDVSKRIAELKRRLASGDLPGAERQAHAINGAAAVIGGEALRQAAFSAEKSAKAGNILAANAFLEEVDAQFRRLCGILRQHQTQGGTPSCASSSPTTI